MTGFILCEPLVACGQGRELVAFQGIKVGVYVAVGQYMVQATRYQRELASHCFQYFFIHKPRFPQSLPEPIFRTSAEGCVALTEHIYINKV